MSNPVPQPTRLVEAAVVERLRSAFVQPLAAGLHVIATPIGNLADLSLRAIATLARANVVYAEDTWHSRSLLDQFGIGTVLRSYHEHNGEAVRPEILDRLAKGEVVALISDAGTPLISDPGYKLVRAASEAGHIVTAVPGASAVMTALSIAGLPTDAFHFAGFLPSKDGQRRTRLAELAMIDATVVVFEAPGRLIETLAALVALLPTREIAVARELTKLHETVRRGRAVDLAEHFTQSPPRGEIVLLIAPPDRDAAPTDARVDAELARALETMSVRDAAAVVAEALGLPKKVVYQRALNLRP
jgi:16S rRNA (cytidine1402-2'-O)-methyltransferase